MQVTRRSYSYVKRDYEPAYRSRGNYPDMANRVNASQFSSLCPAGFLLSRVYAGSLLFPYLLRVLAILDDIAIHLRRDR